MNALHHIFLQSNQFRRKHVGFSNTIEVAIGAICCEENLFQFTFFSTLDVYQDGRTMLSINVVCYKKDWPMKNMYKYATYSQALLLIFYAEATK